MPPLAMPWMRLPALPPMHDLSHDDTLTLYHFGLAVPKLADAIEQYESSFGLTFTELREIPFSALVDGQPRKATMLAAFSRGGPPYLELIEEVSGTIWPADAFGLNHIGFWAKDMAGAISRLEANGLPGRIRLRTQPPLVTYHQSPSALWIELVDEGAMREMIEEWLTTSYR